VSILYVKDLSLRFGMTKLKHGYNQEKWCSSMVWSEEYYLQLMNYINKNIIKIHRLPYNYKDFLSEYFVKYCVKSTNINHYKSKNELINDLHLNDNNHYRFEIIINNFKSYKETFWLGINGKNHRYNTTLNKNDILSIVSEEIMNFNNLLECYVELSEANYNSVVI